MKTVILSKQAEKTLRKMPRNTADTIRAKIAQYAKAPETLANNVTELKGIGGFRLRVGDWRVLFDIDGNVIAVLAIRPRGKAYD